MAPPPPRLLFGVTLSIDALSSSHPLSSIWANDDGLNEDAYTLCAVAKINKVTYM